MLSLRTMGPADERLILVLSFSDVDDAIYHRIPSSSYPSYSLDVFIVVDKSEGGRRWIKTMARVDFWTTTNDYEKFNGTIFGKYVDYCVFPAPSSLGLRQNQSADEGGGGGWEQWRKEERSAPVEEKPPISPPRATSRNASTKTQSK